MQESKLESKAANDPSPPLNVASSDPTMNNERRMQNMPLVIEVKCCSTIMPGQRSSLRAMSANKLQRGEAVSGVTYIEQHTGPRI
jgi:hypothetical protein